MVQPCEETSGRPSATFSSFSRNPEAVTHRIYAGGECWGDGHLDEPAGRRCHLLGRWWWQGQGGGDAPDYRACGSGSLLSGNRERVQELFTKRCSRGAGGSQWSTGLDYSYK